MRVEAGLGSVRPQRDAAFSVEYAPRGRLAFSLAFAENYHRRSTSIGILNLGRYGVTLQRQIQEREIESLL